MKEAVYLEFLAGILESLSTAIAARDYFEVPVVPYSTLHSLEVREEIPHHWAEEFYAITFRNDVKDEIIEVKGFKTEKTLMSFNYNKYTGVPVKVIALAILNYIKVNYYWE